MKAHYAAIETALAALYTTYVVDVPDTPVLPYFVLWGPAGTLPEESTVAGQLSTDFDTDVYVTAVAGTAEGVLTMQAAARTALRSLTVTGHLVALTLTDSRPLMVDRDVILPNTDRHPVYGVDVYRLQSTPS